MESQTKSPDRKPTPATDAPATTSSTDVHGKLRAMILSGELAAGSSISEAAIARELKVSRTPLREALRKLASEGLLDARPHHQTRVAPLSASDLEELYAVRVTLESFGAAVTVPTLTDAELAELDAYLRELNRLSQLSDLHSWEQVHARFHQLLVSHAGDRLRGITSTLADHSTRYITMYLAQPRAWGSAAVEHNAIAEACRARDGELAAARLARHLSRTALTLLAEAAPEYDPGKIRAALSRTSGSERRLA